VSGVCGGVGDGWRSIITFLSFTTTATDDDGVALEVVVVVAL
jgi:hypothetical protein